MSGLLESEVQRVSDLVPIRLLAGRTGSGAERPSVAHVRRASDLAARWRLRERTGSGSGLERRSAALESMYNSSATIGAAAGPLSCPIRDKVAPSKPVSSPGRF